MFDPKVFARSIISQHTEDMMHSSRYAPESNEDLYEYMVYECADILVEDLLDGEISPMEYNAIRNEIAEMLWNTFKSHVEAEWEKKE